MIRALRLFNFADQALQRAFDEVATVIKLITASEVIDGVLVQNVAIVAGTTKYVSHGLGREPLGCVIVRKRADARTWDTQDSNTTPKSTFALNASADVTVDCWFF
jgi:hypothetical protein